MSKHLKKVLRKKKRISQTLPIIAMLAALGISTLTYSVTVSADTGTASSTTSVHMQRGKKSGIKSHTKGNTHSFIRSAVKPTASGVIQSIDGTTVTIKDRNNTVYTIDVSSAHILKASIGKASTTISVSDLKVGDMLGVKGTLTGTTVTATDVVTSPQHPFMKKLHDARTSSKK